MTNCYKMGTYEESIIVLWQAKMIRVKYKYVCSIILFKDQSSQKVGSKFNLLSIKL